MTEQFKNALIALRNAMIEVNSNWPNDDGNIPLLVENYPFETSFDELTIEVQSWIDELVA